MKIRNRITAGLAGLTIAATLGLAGAQTATAATPTASPIGMHQYEDVGPVERWFHQRNASYYRGLAKGWCGWSHLHPSCPAARAAYANALYHGYGVRTGNMYWH